MPEADDGLVIESDTTEDEYEAEDAPEEPSDE